MMLGAICSFLSGQRACLARCVVFLPIIRSFLSYDVIMSTSLELGVVDVLDAAAGLCPDDVGPLPDPAIGSVGRNHVEADLPTLWSGVGPNIVHGQGQALAGFSVTLRLQL